MVFHKKYELISNMGALLHNNEISPQKMSINVTQWVVIDHITSQINF